MVVEPNAPNHDRNQSSVDISDGLTVVPAAATTLKQHSACLGIQLTSDLSTSLLKTILEATVDGILILDNFGQILYSNQRLADREYLASSVFEQGEDEVVMANLLPQLIDGAAFSELVQREYDQPLLETQSLMEFKDGRLFERYSRPYFVQGYPTGRVISCREVTEQRRVEAALRQSQQRLSLHVEQTLLATIECDANLGITAWNPAAERIFGFSQAEAIGQYAIDLIVPPALRQQISQLLQAVFESRRSHVSINQNLTKCGQYLICEWVTTPLIDASGQVIGLTSLAQDITARVQAETALGNAKEELEVTVAQRTAELQAINQQLRQEILDRQTIEKNLQENQVRLQLINHISTGIASGMTLNAVIKQTLQQLQGYFPDLSVSYGTIDKRGNLQIQQSITTSNQIPKTGLKIPLELVPAYLTTLHQLKSVVVEDVEQDHRLHPIANTLIAAEIAAMLLLPLQQFHQLDGVLSFFAPRSHAWSAHEITTLTEIADHLSSVAERQKIAQRKDELIAIVSHELRTPLTTIYGSLKLLVNHRVDGNTTQGKHFINLAAENANRLLRLVDNILDLESLEFGKINFTMQPCNVGDVITKAAEQMQILDDQAGIILSITPAAITCHADVDRLIQVLTNLLGNAIKFSPRGSTIWLTAAIQMDDSQASDTPIRDTQPSTAQTSVLIQVKDQGRGIAPEQLETIFNPFYQVDPGPAQHKEGIGLGLTICRNIVHQHRGEIWAESAVGTGSCFFVKLPLQQSGQQGTSIM
jgi:PAS domain S-box-containing protein